MSLKEEINRNDTAKSLYANLQTGQEYIQHLIQVKNNILQIKTDVLASDFFTSADAAEVDSVIQTLVDDINTKILGM